jgi:hypothetical protein
MKNNHREGLAVKPATFGFQELLRALKVCNLFTFEALKNLAEFLMVRRKSGENVN